VATDQTSQDHVLPEHVLCTHAPAYSMYAAWIALAGNTPAEIARVPHLVHAQSSSCGVGTALCCGGQVMLPSCCSEEGEGVLHSSKQLLQGDRHQVAGVGWTNTVGWVWAQLHMNALPQ
jgi:hypothetical protein